LIFLLIFGTDFAPELIILMNGFFDEMCPEHAENAKKKQ